MSTPAETPDPKRANYDGPTPTPTAQNRKVSMEMLYEEDPTNPIKIRFGRESLEYQPGETITGTVFLQVEKALELKKISIQVMGTGRTSWAVAAENKKKQLNVAHASTESYIDVQFVVVDKAEKLEPGRKEFPFTYALPPPPLPSTIIDAYGSITYVMKVTAETDQPGPGAKLGCMGAFLINGIYDLNEDPLLNQRAELYDHKAVRSCFCIKTGQVELCVNFTHRGFTIGERVTWVADINNKSLSKVKIIQARLIQHALFHADGDIKQDAKPVVTVNAGSVGKRSKESWAGFLDIPPTIPPSTSAGGSNLIVINYALEFEIEIGGCSKNLKTEIPIAIGNVPMIKRTSDGTSVPNKFGKDKPVENVPPTSGAGEATTPTPTSTESEPAIKA